MGNSRNAIVFFDIDGTLTHNNQPPSSNTIKAITLLKQNGHVPIICTGRPLCNIPINLLSLQFNGLITLAGAYIEIEGKVIEDYAISRDMIRKTADKIIEIGADCLLEGTDGCCTIGINKTPLKSKHVAYTVDDLETLFPNLHFSKFIFPKNQISLFDKEIDFFCQYYSLYDIGIGFYEMGRKGVNKAFGIRKVLEHLHHGRENTYGLGDSENDIEMLHEVSTGIVMGNASQVVKSHGEYITRSVDQDGVYYALKHFGLI